MSFDALGSDGDSTVVSSVTDDSGSAGENCTAIHQTPRLNSRGDSASTTDNSGSTAGGLSFYNRQLRLNSQFATYSCLVILLAVVILNPLAAAAIVRSLHKFWKLSSTETLTIVVTTELYFTLPLKSPPCSVERAVEGARAVAFYGSGVTARTRIYISSRVATAIRITRFSILIFPEE